MVYPQAVTRLMFVVTCQYVGTSVLDNHLYILLEYVACGSLHGMLKEFGPFSEDVIVHYTRQILLGLRYLHKKHIVHRDVKGTDCPSHPPPPSVRCPSAVFEGDWHACLQFRSTFTTGVYGTASL